MSIGGLMRTSVSGMNAQATRLAGVADNIANANTTGYKRQSTEFSALVVASGGGQYNSGIVEANTRQIVSEQGVLTASANNTSSQAVDLGVNGKGFFVVSDGAGGTFLTRAGAFVKNGNGELVNAAGYVLQGYPLPDGDTEGVLNGFAGLRNVNLDSAQLRLKPTDSGIFRVNLPKDSPVLPPRLAGTAGTATQTDVIGAGTFAADAETLTFEVAIDRADPVKVTITAPQSGKLNELSDSQLMNAVVDGINTALGKVVASNNGNRLVLTSQSNGPNSTVALTNVQVDSADATIAGLADMSGTGELGALDGTRPGAGGTGKVNYTATDSIIVYDDAGKEIVLDIYMTKVTDGSGSTPEGPNTWEYAIYDRATRSPGETPFPYSTGPIGGVRQVVFDRTGALQGTQPLAIQIPNGQMLQLDITGSSQVGKTYQPISASVNGNPPGNVDQIQISADGVISARFKSGELVPLFKVPLALVESPDNLRAHSGNVFSAGQDSGEVLVGFGGESGLGAIVHGALEQSTVDLASELTTMIESQRSYTANSKVFQTGSEILDVLVNLKR